MISIASVGLGDAPITPSLSSIPHAQRTLDNISTIIRYTKDFFIDVLLFFMTGIVFT
jgi:hypothetical protein